MPSLANNQVRFNNELADTDTAYKSVTGKSLSKFFRPPMGEYSQKTLYLTQQLGYKTIFWRFAHRGYNSSRDTYNEMRLRLIVIFSFFTNRTTFPRSSAAE